MFRESTMSNYEIIEFNDENIDTFQYHNDANKLRQALHFRVRRMGNDYLKVGNDLYIVYHRQHYLDWGHATYEDFIENEIGIGYEAAQRYKRYWKRMIKDSGCSFEDLEGLSISHIGILSRVITRDTADFWVDKAKSLTCNQLSYEVKKEKDKKKGKIRDVVVIDTDKVSEVPIEPEEIIIDVQAEIKNIFEEIKPEKDSLREQEPDDVEEQEALTKLMVPLFTSQLATVREALAKSERMSGSDKIGHNLTLIATHFLANTAQRGKSFDNWIAFLLKSLELSVGGKFLWIKEEGFKDCPKEIAEFLGIKGVEDDNTNREAGV